MTVDYLKEELDGFYQYVEEGTNKNVFYNGETKKFYASKDEAKEGEGTEIANAVKGKLIVPKFTFELENEGMKIIALAVSKEYRRKGIGTALLKTAEQWAKENNIEVILLNSGLPREDAHAFYESQGYFKKSYGFIKKI